MKRCKNILILILLMTLSISIHCYGKEINEEAEEHYKAGTRAYFNEADYKKAIDEFLKMIEIDPNHNTYAYYLLGDAYYYVGNYEKAVEYFKYVLANYDLEDLTILYYFMGDSYEHLGFPDKALEAYKNASKEADPNTQLYSYENYILKIYSCLARLYEDDGSNELAIFYYENCLEYESDPEIIVDYKSKIKKMNSNSEQISEVNNIQSFIDSAYDYYYQGAYDEAIQEAGEALKTDENLTEGHYILAMCYDDQGNFDEAIKEYKKVIDLDLKYIKAYQNLALLFINKSEYKNAVDYFNKFLTLASSESQKVNANRYLGQCYFNLKNYSQSITHYEKVIDFSPEDSLSIYNLGLAYWKSGNEEKALEYFEKSIELDPEAEYAPAAEKNIAALKNLELDYTSIEPEEISSLSVTKGQNWAVVIGIGEYESPEIRSLNYSVADAEGIYEFLTTEGKYEKDNVKLLVNEEATTKNIKSALGTFLYRKAMEEDTVFIYYSGHGAPEPDPASMDGDGLSKYIVSFDSDPQDLYATAYPMKDIIEIFQRIEAKKIIFFVDACYSGASGGKTFSRPGMKAGNISDDFLEELAEGEGRLVITASDANEVSLEVSELGHGVFTYYLLEGLNGSSDINNDSIITVDELYDYLYKNVVKTSKEFGGNQHPLKKGETSGRFIIIRY